MQPGRFIEPHRINSVLNPAHDTKFDHHVAVKILPSAIATDPWLLRELKGKP